MSQVLKDQFLVIIGLVLIDVEIFAIKVEKTVREFVTGQCSHDQLTFVSINHSASGYVAPTPFSRIVRVSHTTIFSSIRLLSHLSDFV